MNLVGGAAHGGVVRRWEPPVSVLSRRAVLFGAAGAGAAATLAACSRVGGSAPDASALAAQVAQAEAARPITGQTRRLRLTAQPVQVDLAGRVVTTWAYGGTVPGPMLRATAGDRVQVEVSNGLPEETSVHWHGLALRNDMDGVPGLYHPGDRGRCDVRVRLRRLRRRHLLVPPAPRDAAGPGLYAPFIVDATDEAGPYDLEWVVVLDDWTDGVGQSPPSSSSRTSVDAGREGATAWTTWGWAWAAWAGGPAVMSTTPCMYQRSRPRGTPTSCRRRPASACACGSSTRRRTRSSTWPSTRTRLSVTHTDGYPVNPVPASVIRLGMGERSDATVTLTDGVFPLVAQPVGKSGLARALVRTGSGAVPAVTYRPRGSSTVPADHRRAGTAAPGAALPAADAAGSQDVVLGGSMAPYVWTINGRTYDEYHRRCR